MSFLATAAKTAGSTALANGGGLVQALGSGDAEKIGKAIGARLGASGSQPAVTAELPPLESVSPTYAAASGAIQKQQPTTLSSSDALALLLRRY